MAYSYFFMRPAHLPLEVHELSEQTVLLLSDPDEARSGLERVVPGLTWPNEHEARATTADGRWLEFYLPGNGRDTFSLRCSLRSDYSDVVQGLCDTLSWIAFDEMPRLFQPHRPPVFCGG